MAFLRASLSSSWVDSFSCQNTDFNVSLCRASSCQGFHSHYSGASHRHSGLLIALAEHKMVLSPLFECCSEQRDERFSGPWHNGSWFWSPPASWELPGAVHEQLMWQYCWWLTAHARQPLFQLLPLTFLFNALFSSKMLLVKGGGRRSQAIIC